MDKINDIIDLGLFMIISFSLLWIVDKIQKYIKQRRLKNGNVKK